MPVAIAAPVPSVTVAIAAPVPSVTVAIAPFSAISPSGNASQTPSVVAATQYLLNVVIFARLSPSQFNKTNIVRRCDINPTLLSVVQCKEFKSSQLKVRVIARLDR